MKKSIPRRIVLIGFFTIFLLGNTIYLKNTEENILDNSIKNIESSQSPPIVMASISICQDIVQNIMGDLGTVDSIVTGSQDIHTFAGPTDAQKIAMSKADIFFAMGLPDIEPWLQDTLDGLGENGPSVIVYLIQESMIEYDEVIGSNNPHIWMDPNNVKIFADNITRELSVLDSDNAAIFTSNNATYCLKLDALLSRIAGNATIFSGLKVVENHPAFKYFFDLLGVVRIDVIEKVEGEEPTSSDIAAIIEKMQNKECHLLINARNSPQDEVNEIARNTESKIAYLTAHGGTDAEGNVLDTYIEMMDYNLLTLANPEDPPSISGYSVFILFGLISISIVIFKKFNKNLRIS